MHIDITDVLLVLSLLFLGSWVWLVFETLRFVRYSKHFHKRVDAFVVLGSRTHLGKQYHPSLVARVTCASKLIDKGLSNTIILSGGKTGRGGMKEAVAMEDIFRRINHNPSVRIITETRSRSTRGNIYYVKKLMKEHHIGKIAIVTEEHHAPRAFYIAKKFGLNAYIVSNTMSPLWRRWKFFSYGFLRESLFFLPNLLMK